MAVSLPHYPPPEDLSNELPPQQHYVRRASSSLPPNAYEDASLKYPTLENVEHDYDKKKNQKQQQSVNESDFPDVSKVSQFNNRGEEMKEEEIVVPVVQVVIRNLLLNQNH